MVKRNQGKFYVNNAKTERYKNSTIPFMQRLLNKYEAKGRVKKMIFIILGSDPP